MSTRPRIYLDFNATTPLVEAARTAMAEVMAETGNPSSVHAEGRRARDRVERARNQVAALVGRPREQIVFTSGGTEANLLGVRALAVAAERHGRPKVVVTSAIEHPSLLGAVRSLEPEWTVELLPVTGAADYQLRDLGPFGLLAVALVNHELGKVLDDDVIAWARRAGALVHLDAVQAVGKRGSVTNDADAIAVSGHKIGGPQGIGALAIAVDEALPLIAGGHQERGRRAGTENTIGIAGFGAAAQAIDLAARRPLASLTAKLARGLTSIPNVRIHPTGTADDLRRFDGSTINAGFAGARGESIVMALDLEGVAVSTGAACTSGSVQPSPVLLGLGMPPERALEAVRFSLGPTTSEAEIDEVLRILPGIVERARKHR